MIAKDERYESDIQSEIIEAIKSWGWRYTKNDPSAAGIPRGWPDLTVYGPDMTIVFIETKRPSQELKAIQDYWRRVLRRFGFPVYRIDNLGHAVRILRREHERAVESAHARRTG